MQDIESIKHQYQNHLVETFPRLDAPALPLPVDKTTSGMAQNHFLSNANPDCINSGILTYGL